MKIKEGFILKELANKYIIIPKASSNIDLTSMITLNKTGKVLFENMQTTKSVDDLVNILLNRFDVSEDIARSDVLEFIEKLRINNLLDE